MPGPAPSCRALAAEPWKPEPSRAILNGSIGLKAQLALEEALSQAVQLRLSSVDEVLHPQLIPGPKLANQEFTNCSHVSLNVFVPYAIPEFPSTIAAFLDTLYCALNESPSDLQNMSS